MDKTVEAQLDELLGAWVAEIDSAPFAPTELNPRLLDIMTYSAGVVISSAPA